MLGEFNQLQNPFDLVFPDPYQLLVTLLLNSFAHFVLPSK